MTCCYVILEKCCYTRRRTRLHTLISYLLLARPFIPDRLRHNIKMEGRKRSGYETSMLQLWIAPRAILRTVDCQTRPTTEKTTCERERTGPACLRNDRTEGRTVSSAKRARQGQAGCLEHGRRENFSSDQRTVEYIVRGRLHRR